MSKRQHWIWDITSLLGQVVQLETSTTPPASTPRAPTELTSQQPLLKPVNEDALNQLRRELEIERIEVDRWKKDQQRQIAEQRQKMQEAEHSMLEEKIRSRLFCHSHVFERLTEFYSMVDTPRSGLETSNHNGQIICSILRHV